MTTKGLTLFATELLSPLSLIPTPFKAKIAHVS